MSEFRQFKPALWDASWWARTRHRVLVVRLALRCSFKGHEVTSWRPTRCVTVSACRLCGWTPGASVDRSDPERECMWFKPSMIVDPPDLCLDFNCAQPYRHVVGVGACTTPLTPAIGDAE